MLEEHLALPVLFAPRRFAPRQVNEDDFETQTSQLSPPLARKLQHRRRRVTCKATVGRMPYLDECLPDDEECIANWTSNIIQMEQFQLHRAKGGPDYTELRAARMGELGTETAFEVLAKAKKLEAEGKHIIHLEIGEPDFDTPENIVAEGVKAMQSGDTHYTPAAGTARLKEAVVSHIRRTRGVEVEPENCLAFPGAKPIMFFTMLALIEAGDEVIYPNPGFPIYESMISFCGGTPVALPMLEEKAFRFDAEHLERLITPRTKLIILNTPGNPTGGVLTHEDLEHVASLAKEHDITILSDEVYDMILYDGATHESMLALPGMLDRTILLAGHSKNYAMTGWRMGYGVFPPTLAPMIQKLIVNSNSCTAAFTQAAAAEALDGPQSATHEMVEEFRARRDIVVEGLTNMGLTCQAPQGAFYIFPSIRGAGVPHSSAELADYFLYSCGVALLDGTCFGAHGDGYLRLSYANSRENLQLALERIKEGLERLRADNSLWPCAATDAAIASLEASYASGSADLEQVGFVSAMVLALMGNYSGTGHYGGPLSYIPSVVALHLAGGENGGLRYDIRSPKAPLTDKYMMTAGHCANTNYSVWMVLYEAMRKHRAATGDSHFDFSEEAAVLAQDALGFRRNPQAAADLLKDHGLEDHPLFAGRGRPIRPLMGHAETTDVTNDVNGGPSGIGVANAAGKAMFWDMVGAPEEVKVWALEGEFAFTEGHAQELKTIAAAQQVGKRLRVLLSNNNAGIDDALIGKDGKSGVVPEGPIADQYDLALQFSSYGWNVFEVKDGGSYEQLVEVMAKTESWPQDDRRPMVIIANTVKGWWPADIENQIVGHQSHPYGHAMNGEYFQALAASFEERFGVRFDGIADGPVSGAERIVQFQQNIDVALSVLDQDDGRLAKWVAERLTNIAYEHGAVEAKANLSVSREGNPFKDRRLRLDEIPLFPVDVNPSRTVELFAEVGRKWGARRAISEVGAWINHVTGNRWITVAADLSSSINIENASLTGHYDPIHNPSGTRLKAGIQECGNASTVCGLASQTVSSDPSEHIGFWGVSGTYGAFTPLMYLPLRIFAQQKQDSPFDIGVVTIVAGHSGPETAADARSHFGIFSPQVWTLFPEGQVINLHLWDYNDVAPAYFGAMQHALSHKEVAGIVIHVARPDSQVADRSRWADSDIMAASKGAYVIREYDRSLPRHGTIVVQGTSSMVSVLDSLPRLAKNGHNVRVVYVVSEELFNTQPESYRERVMSDADRVDCMVVTTGTKRVMPLAMLGPLTKEYSMSSDHDDKWRTGGLEAEIIREAKLDPESVFQGITRFAEARFTRFARQRTAVKALFDAE
ncbi:hypothetical protein CYMTET_40211 [Cymbomonas tetramitiformis]|uniref:Uncharacterized protein n=1 Tax=Cymbomonas tetramitiformis TaxID=36881 RepID=A0AAE0C9K4_9CHLO|nr:hypothetical protein CYMTET_40211 [Cymbomonas tetramitiformis]